MKNQATIKSFMFSFKSKKVNYHSVVSIVNTTVGTNEEMSEKRRRRKVENITNILNALNIWTFHVSPSIRVTLIKLIIS